MNRGRFSAEFFKEPERGLGKPYGIRPKLEKPPEKKRGGETKQPKIQTYRAEPFTNEERRQQESSPAPKPEEEVRVERDPFKPAVHGKSSRTGRGKRYK